MEADDDFDMQLIGHFLSCASRGDKVGLNQMLREGCSPNVQDYDHRTALHLAASEGHASIVELLLHYKANVNLKDRWKRTALTDARLYGHRDICRILEVNGGMDFLNDHSQTLQHERGMSEVNIEASELNLMHSSIIEQGLFGESEKVKWRGTWVVQTRIKRHIIKPVELILSAKDITLLRELRHPNIVQFLGSLEQGEEIFLITEYLSKGNLHEILTRRIRFDFNTSVRYALDIARGINYLHEHKPYPIVHNNLSTRNLLQDEGGHLKIGEYWVQMLYERTHPHQEDRDGINSNSIHDTKKDIYLFANIFYQMLEGEILHSELARLKSSNVEPKFKLSRCPMRIRELVKACRSMDPSKRPTFAAVIEILEEASGKNSRSGCPVC
ncbi:non-specific serine/threonine protein kinase [Ranunculus cassubicifolius]